MWVGRLQACLVSRLVRPSLARPPIAGPPTHRTPSLSHRCTMVAPVARAMRLLSVLRTRRMAEISALDKKWTARSDRP